MKRMLTIFVLMCSVSVVCLASATDVEIGSCSICFSDDWGFVEYTGDFDKVSESDRMFFNVHGDVALLSVFSETNCVPHSTQTDLFISANKIIKSFQKEDGSSIVTLGEVDGYPRITIIDENESFSRTQWFIFSDNDVVYIGFQSPDKYRLRSYDAMLHNLNVN